MLKPVDIKFFKMCVGHSNIGKETGVDISAKCPVCGDSSNKRKKRLHLYEKGGETLVNCFNGDCQVHNNVWNFIKMTKPELLNQYKRETFGNQIERLKKAHDGDFEWGERPTKEKSVPQPPIVHHDLTSFFKPLRESQEALDYLQGRNITYDETKFGKWYVGFQDLKIGEITYKITNTIIIPLYFNNIMYAFYSRSYGQKYFCTYNPEANIGYKVWNWFNIDKELPVYIFESIFDAISSGKKNIIALMGAKLPNDRLAEMKQPVFCLDNDKTGKKNGVEYAEMGHRIFIIPEHIKEKDMNEIVNNHPNLNISDFIDENTFKGMRAIVRLKRLL